MPTSSYWNATGDTNRYSALEADLEVDVAVIGGGNTGITTACLLSQAGLRVGLFERDRCARGDTGHTSAHLTYVTDLRLRELESRFGKSRTRTVWDAGMAAIQQIETLVKMEHIDCGFARIPGYLYASIDEERDESQTLQEETELAKSLGLSADYRPHTPLFNRPGILFPDQARIHPIKYAAGLLAQITQHQGRVFEGTEVTEFDEDSKRFNANGHTVTFQYVVLATDVPLMGRTGLLAASLLQTKIAPYTSYVISAKVADNSVPDGLFWDTSDPYYFLRLARGADHDVVVFGGCDHKTGQNTTEDQFERLETQLRRFVPNFDVTYRWSGQVIESSDGLPLIGQTSEGQFVATGFSGNGLTFGTVAAMVIRDAIVGNSNRFCEMFDVQRVSLHGWGNYLRENADFPYYMIKDRLTPVGDADIDDLKPGEGKLVSLGGKRIAVYRNADNGITYLSPICSHLGCIVHWNALEATWDCPCHGSRFYPEGGVLTGPAETPLARVVPNA